MFLSLFHAPSVIRNGENKKKRKKKIVRGRWGGGLGSGRMVTQCGPYRSEG